MSDTSEKGRDLIFIAFGVVLVHIIFIAIYQWILVGNFPVNSLATIAITIFACIKVLSKNEWAKYGAIIWSVINIATSLHSAFQYKIYALVIVAFAFLYLIATLSFSKSVDAYLFADVATHNDPKD
jgi:hypothetical protein